MLFDKEEYEHPGQDNNNAIASVTLPTYAYRYGFNGQERENEINNTGAYSTEYWFCDGRLGRRWNVDPVETVGISSYACFYDNPFMYADPNGDDAKDRAEKWANKHKDQLYRDCPESMEDCPATIESHIGKNGALYSSVKLNDPISGQSLKVFNPTYFEIFKAKRYEKKITSQIHKLSKTLEAKGENIEDWMNENFKVIGWGLDVNRKIIDKSKSFANGNVQIQNQTKIYANDNYDVVDGNIVNNTTLQGEIGYKENINYSVETSYTERYFYLFISNNENQKSKLKLKVDNQTTIQFLVFKATSNIGSGTNTKDEYKIGLTSNLGIGFKHVKKGKIGYGKLFHIDFLSTYRK